MLKVAPGTTYRSPHQPQFLRDRERHVGQFPAGFAQDVPGRHIAFVGGFHDRRKEIRAIELVSRIDDVLDVDAALFHDAPEQRSSRATIARAQSFPYGDLADPSSGTFIGKPRSPSSATCRLLFG